VLLLDPLVFLVLVLVYQQQQLQQVVVAVDVLGSTVVAINQIT
jgi:hypothetical protein